MMQNIASQILSETTPSESQAPVTPSPEISEQPATENTQKPLDDFESRFSILTKMEKKIKEQKAQFEGRSKEWEEKESKLKEYEELVKLLDENPLEALKKRKGWGVHEFNEFAVKNASDDDLDPVARITKTYEERMAELEKKLTSTMEEKIKAKEDEIRAKEHEGQIKEFKSGIKTFLVENKDAYEFINAEENGAEHVYDLIFQDIMKQKEAGIEDDQLKIMDIKDAAEKVEAFLDKAYSKYLSLNKVKSKLGTTEEDALKKFFKTPSDPETLNSSFSPKSKPVSELSAEERRQAAIDFIRSQKT